MTEIARGLKIPHIEAPIQSDIDDLLTGTGCHDRNAHQSSSNLTKGVNYIPQP